MPGILQVGADLCLSLYSAGPPACLLGPGPLQPSKFSGKPCTCAQALLTQLSTQIAACMSAIQRATRLFFGDVIHLVPNMHIWPLPVGFQKAAVFQAQVVDICISTFLLAPLWTRPCCLEQNCTRLKRPLSGSSSNGCARKATSLMKEYVDGAGGQPACPGPVNALAAGSCCPECHQQHWQYRY